MREGPLVTAPHPREWMVRTGNRAGAVVHYGAQADVERHAKAAQRRGEEVLEGPRQTTPAERGEPAARPRQGGQGARGYRDRDDDEYG